MSNSDLLLAAMVAAVLATAVSFLIGDLAPSARKIQLELRQTGDSSLKPRSVNWLAAAALLLALLICLGLR